MGQPTDPESFPDCTRCGHPFEDHIRPEGKGPHGEGLPWPCRICDCPGFVVSRELHEDVRHMAGLRLQAAVEELRGDGKMTREEVRLHVEQTQDAIDAEP